MAYSAPPEPSLYDAAIGLAIEKKMISQGQEHDYPENLARSTDRSYVLVNAHTNTLVRQTIEDVESHYELIRGHWMEKRAAALLAADNLLAKKWEESNRKKSSKRVEEISRWRLNSKFSYVGLLGMIAGVIMIVNGMSLSTNSAIHQIYQILLIIGGIISICLSGMNQKAKRSEAYLESLIDIMSDLNQNLNRAR
jgi:hypothetical protein